MDSTQDSSNHESKSIKTTLNNRHEEPNKSIKVSLSSSPLPQHTKLDDPNDNDADENQCPSIVCTSPDVECEVPKLLTSTSPISKRRGHSVLQVFHIKINCEGFVNGTISATSSNGLRTNSHLLCHHVPGCYVHAGDSLRPRSSAIVLSKDDTIIIKLHLNHYKHETWHSIIKNTHWTVDCRGGQLMDKPLTEVFSSDDHPVSATMLYAFIGEAYKATLEFTLLDNAAIRSNERGLGVYGSAVATNGLFVAYPECERTLFRSNRNQQRIQPGQKICGAGGVVVVPVEHDLIVYVNFKSLEVDIPSAKLTFPGKQFGASVQHVGEIIQVKVTWTPVGFR